MTLTTGTLSLDDIIENKFLSVYSYGANTILEVIDRDLGVANKILNDQLNLFAAPTAERQAISGTSVLMSMTRVDETSRPPTQQVSPGAVVGFPLYKFSTSIGWNSEFFKQGGSGATMGIQVRAAQAANARQATIELKKAIYNPTDFTFYEQWEQPQNLAFPLTVKAFLNADGDPVPLGPNGEVFATSHTHYVGAASAAAADVLGIINTVLEHGYGEGLCLFINSADEAFIRSLTTVFSPFVDQRFTINANSSVPMERLDPTIANNRPIGYIGAATVWVKPWALQNYFFACSVGTGNKPFMLRSRDQALQAGLRLVAQNDAFPLHANFWESLYGIGVWNRANGAVLFNGNASYQAPTIADA